MATTAPLPTGKAAPSLTFTRHFSSSSLSPYDEVQWERRDAVISDFAGRTIFEQKDVEVPVDWSMTATNIVASKYLHGAVGSPSRETGVRQLVARVVETVRDWGMAGGYFQTPADAAIFHDELVHLLVHQKVAFNSPVWFNVGCDRLEPDSEAQNWHWNEHSCAIEFSVAGYSKPQCSACFINAVEDSLDSILTLAKTEGMLFKWGSGTGTNLSTLRASTEQLSGGGTASGPLSFMRGFDAFAGVIKSGGKTRRAAKMVILNVDHPDIVDFIECKMKEEAKAWALMREGYDGSSGPDSEAYSSIFFQNANNSVRVTDEFMQAAERDGEFTTRAVRSGVPVGSFKARELLHKIAESTWACGDPGMQYDTTINRWHTAKNTARINASNPCSEYMFLDNSACNLASFNLLRFVDARGSFDIDSYRRAIDVMITAMDILIDNSGYPTEAIACNSHDYRPLGLGYANLGALLMSFGLPYDSDAGREVAGALTAILSGEAYLQSARLAEHAPAVAPATPLTGNAKRSGGAAPGFYNNREPFLDVIRMHRAEVSRIGRPQPALLRERVSLSNGMVSRSSGDLPEAFIAPQLAELVAASKDCWDKALTHGEKHGYRNAQVTVLAPTGTIGFMMDCDTTGIEPDLALVKFKKLVGGGMMKIVNGTVAPALSQLGYSSDEVDAIVSYIDATGTIEGAPSVSPEHLAVFDCSFKPAKGTRSISPAGHVRMMAAAQPFLSGAISKTVNLPHDATVADVADVYFDAWRLGLKSVAIYRDGSKGAQPLNVSDGEGAKATGTGKTAPIAASGDLAMLNRDLAAAHARLAGVDRKVADLRAAAAGAGRLATAEEDVVLGKARDLPRSPTAPAQPLDGPPRAVRHRLPDERASLTHKFSIGGHEGYITVGLYPSGAPGEIFIKMAKEGSTVSGLMDSFATATSLALQHGVPLKVLCEKFAHSRFEPSGWTGSETLGYAKSIMDYLFRWLELRFLSGVQLPLFAGLQPGGKGAGPGGFPTGGSMEGGRDASGRRSSEVGAAAIPVAGALDGEGVLYNGGDAAERDAGGVSAEAPIADRQTATAGVEARSDSQGSLVHEGAAFGSGSTSLPVSPRRENPGLYHAADAMRSLYDMGDAPSCQTCGAIMVRSGSCYRCLSCGSTSGCS